MLAALLRLVAGRCPVHDRPSAHRIAALEAATGINPDAPALHRANAASFTEAFANPEIIDCGRPRCARRRA
ncbi:hypothetical protein AB0P17_36600 [Streptomyces sp. NPDC088124]|uniref:hypothetical protein n=1 Tax=unclassified Streptomyces TaxID=2593676 RepID=UPI003420EB0B